ncbi:MAG: lectin-like protein [Acidimicrobiales bacterium]
MRSARNTSHRSTDQGFTLVEILVAIVLVGILSAVGVVGVGSLTSRGATAGCAASLDAARAAASVQLASTGSYPTTFTQMTGSNSLSLPSSATVAPSGVVVTGSGWTLAMLSGGIGAPPVFVCSTDLPSGWTVGPNGHLYLAVATPSNWATAAAAAQATVVNGMTGHLATITSAAEGAFVLALTTDNLWLGGSDAALEGDWRWVSGPETGTPFWSGNYTGSAVGGAYTTWRTWEPNDNFGQDCLRRVSGSADWDDGTCTTLYSYVIEIG